MLHAYYLYSMLPGKQAALLLHRPQLIQPLSTIICKYSNSRDGRSRIKPLGRRSSRQQQEQQQEQQSGRPSKRHQNRYLVSCHPGLEEVTANELRQPWLGDVKNVEVVAPGRVTFGSDSLAAGYAAAVSLRSATRVLHLIHEQQLDPYRAAGDTVYEATRAAAAWQQLLAPGQTLGVHCLHFFNNSNITNSQLVGRRVRDAVCDAVRDARGVRPSPPTGTPDLPIVFQMLSDKLQLFRDVGGGSLHRRGYRSGAAVHKAALNEAAAAGLLLLAGWHEQCQQAGIVLADPMCGSGTFLIEAALIATHTAPGLLRQGPWPFENWHDFEQQQWQSVLQAAQQQAELGRQAWTAGGGLLLGNDMHEGALNLARQAAEAAGMMRHISLHKGECGSWQPPQTPNMVVANPPWGLRLMGQPDGNSSSSRRQQDRRGERSSRNTGRYDGQQQQQEEVEDSELVETWQQLSQFLKQQCAGADAWVLSGSPSVTQYLAMRSCRKRSISIGGMKTAWLKYEVRAPRT